MIDPDAATPELIRLVVPMGYGLVGVVMAGLIGAILSSIDSLVNSASTLVTFDLYKKYVRPEATDTECLHVGKAVLAALLSISAILALVTYDPLGSGNFFLRVSSQAGHFTPGLVVAFALGMFWPRATARGAVLSIVTAPMFSFAVVEVYARLAGGSVVLTSLFGAELNFMHRVLMTVLFATLVHVMVSLGDRGDNPGAGFTAVAQGAFTAAHLKRVSRDVALLTLSCLALALAVSKGALAPGTAAVLAAGLGWWPFLPFLRIRFQERIDVTDELLWSAVLVGATLFLMFRFF